MNKPNNVPSNKERTKSTNQIINEVQQTSTETKQSNQHPYPWSVSSISVSARHTFFMHFACFSLLLLDVAQKRASSTTGQPMLAHLFVNTESVKHHSECPSIHLWKRDEDLGRSHPRMIFMTSSTDVLRALLTFSHHILHGPAKLLFRLKPKPGYGSCDPRTKKKPAQRLF